MATSERSPSVSGGRSGWPSEVGFSYQSGTVYSEIPSIWISESCELSIGTVIPHFRKAGILEAAIPGLLEVAGWLFVQ